MGGDGGSIPGRRDLVPERTRKIIEEDPKMLGNNRWTTCGLSNEPLRKPIVMDDIGNVYNKTSAIQYLLSKHKVTYFSHIRSLRDIHDCQVVYKNEPTDDKEKIFIACPKITDWIANGKYCFVRMNCCGWIISEKAMLMGDNECVQCGAVYKKKCLGESYIPLLPNIEEVDLLRDKMIARMEKRREDKLKRKREKMINKERRKKKIEDIDIDSNMTMLDFLITYFPEKSHKWKKWVKILNNMDIETVKDVQRLTKETWSSIKLSPVLKDGLFSLRIKKKINKKKKRRKNKNKSNPGNAQLNTNEFLRNQQDKDFANDVRWKSESFRSIFLPRQKPGPQGIDNAISTKLRTPNSV